MPPIKDDTANHIKTAANYSKSPYLIDFAAQQRVYETFLTPLIKEYISRVSVHYLT